MKIEFNFDKLPALLVWKNLSKKAEDPPKCKEVLKEEEKKEVDLGSVQSPRSSKHKKGLQISTNLANLVNS